MKYAGKQVGMMPSNQNNTPAPTSNTTTKTGSFAGKPNTLGGGGRAAQLKANGVSGGLIGYLGRKKFGNKAMSQMAAAGKKSA